MSAGREVRMIRNFSGTTARGTSRRRASRICATAMAAALLAVITYGQNESQDQTRAHGVRRPRIGLGLGGGGALGVAHNGVMLWVGEHHNPVGYVAGTSMGALVGGIYATGHSPEDLRKIISGIQWTEVIRGATP